MNRCDKTLNDTINDLIDKLNAIEEIYKIEYQDKEFIGEEYRKKIVLEDNIKELQNTISYLLKYRCYNIQ